MKLIGIIGGLSWHSSAEYYRLVNERVHRRLGLANAARLLLYSFNFQEMVELQDGGHLDALEAKILEAGAILERAGVELVAFGANSTHRFADAFEERIRVPLVHIADVTAAAATARSYRRVGLLGTKPTMQLGFYKDRLARHGVEALVPTEAQMDAIHKIIFSELVRGVITAEAKRALVGIIDDLAARGAEAIVLGCTELPLILRPDDHRLPLLNTTELHAQAIADASL